MGGVIAPPKKFAAGDVWIVYFDPAIGHEQQGRRPAVVISGERLNAIPSELVFLVPATTTALGVRSHVRVYLAEGNLACPSYAMTEQIRSMSQQRLRRRVGSVDRETLELIRQRVRWFMDFD